MYKCISCGITWGDESDLEYSHGYCVDCFKERIAPFYHKEQLKYSGNLCFGTCQSMECVYTDCKYREICLGSLKKG